MKITEVRFTVSDLETAKSFFGGTLGMPTKASPHELAVHAGTTRLTISEGDSSWGALHLAFTVPSNTFDEAKEWLHSRTNLLSADGEDEFECAPAWNARSVYFSGPDGSILEFIVRRELTDAIAEPFGGNSIVSVSEVGLPASDVPGLAQQLADDFGIHSYAQGFDGFRPVGDVDGLLILVEDGRTWFPTDDRRAIPQQVEVRVTGGSAVGTIRVNALTTLRVER